MTQTRTTADAVLKDFYLPPLRDILNNKIFLLSQVEKTSERVEGRQVVLALKMGRNQGVGARAENAALPTPGQQRYNNVKVQVKYEYGSFEITGPTFRSMETSRGSFVRPLESEMEGLVTDLKDDMERQLHGDGTGVLATANGAGNAGGVIPVTAMSLSMQRFIVPGMVFTVYQSTGDTVRIGPSTVETVTSTSIDGTANASTVVSGDVIRREGVTSTVEVTGIQKIVSATGQLYGIDPATEPGWASYTNSSAGAISEDMFTIASQEANVRTGLDIDLWLVTNTIHRGYAKLLQSLRRYNEPLNLRGGYKALDTSYMGQADMGGKSQGMVWTKYMPDGVAIGLNTDRLQWDRMSDWEFMDEDGAILQRAVNVTRRDAYEATAFCYADLCTDNRAAHAKLAAITVP